MLIEHHRCTKTVQIIGGAEDVYHCVLLARMNGVPFFATPSNFAFTWATTTTMHINSCWCQV